MSRRTSSTERMALTMSFAIAFVVMLTGFAEGSGLSSGNRSALVGVKTIELSGTVVDSKGNPSPNATVIAMNPYKDIKVESKTDASGKFQISVNHQVNGLESLRLSATSSDGTLARYFRIPYSTKPDELDEIEIQLEDLTSPKIRVVDQAGKPIVAANAVLKLAYPMTTEIVQTDADGIATFSIPKSEKIEVAVAWKNGAGLDYKLYSLPSDRAGGILTQAPEFPRTTFEQLALEGAAPLSFHVADRMGNTISDASASVWLLKKESEPDKLNLSYFQGAFNSVAGGDGTLVFEWFPAWQTGPVWLWSDADGYYRARESYEPGADDPFVEFRLEKLLPLEGTVTYPDGSPAAGITVRAQGNGYTFDNFQNSTMTNEQGRYVIMAAPNMAYMLNIDDDQWAAPSQSGFALLPDEPIEDHAFTLSAATRLHGRVFDATTEQPIAGQFVRLTHYGTELDENGDEVLPNPENSRLSVTPIWHRSATTNDKGQFEFAVGDGDFKLFVLGFDVEELTVSGESEREVDLRADLPKQLQLKGHIVDGRTNEPIQNAQVEAVSRNFHTSKDWKAVSNENGDFEVMRTAESTYLYVTTPDKKLKNIVLIEADETEVEIPLLETVSASGKLLTIDGSNAAPGIALSYGITIRDPEQSLFMHRFGGKVETDMDGTFTLTGLVPDWEYTCQLSDSVEGYMLTVTKVEVAAGDVTELGDLKMPEPPEPYVPPTLEERIATAFGVAGSPVERFDRVKERIKVANQNLIIIFGEPDDSRVESFYRLHFEDSDFRPYQDDFLPMAISTKGESYESAMELTSVLGIPALPKDSKTRMVVVDHLGQVVTSIDSDKVSDGEELSKLAFFAVLDKYKTTPLDAQELLGEALARAKRENKRVILQETATWCGPCQKLSRLLLANRQWEQDYIWIKMDHRWTGAIEIMEEFRDGAQGGIPWWAILDAEGNKLVTSNLEESGRNIGCPSEPDGLKHFEMMLKSTRLRLSDDEIKELVKAFGNSE